MMTREITYAQAVREALDQAMQMEENVVLIGQGTRGAGHIFGTVEGLFEKYGEERVIEMPLAEGAIAGIAIGAALDGLRPVLVLQRADFLYLAMDPLINHASKWHSMFGGKSKVPLVIRAIVGKGWGQGPQHSQNLHGLFAHFPGFRVVYPSSPYDAKGLLLNSIFSDDPVLFFEGRPSHFEKGSVPENPYVVPFGKAKLLEIGNDITIIGISFCVQEALKAVGPLKEMEIAAEVIDLCSIQPLDMELIEKSVSKTKRLLIVDNSWEPCGISAEIAARVQKTFFKKMAAPVERYCFPFAPTPTAQVLEDLYYPGTQGIIERCQKLFR